MPVQYAPYHSLARLILLFDVPLRYFCPFATKTPLRLTRSPPMHSTLPYHKHFTPTHTDPCHFKCRPCRIKLSTTYHSLLRSPSFSPCSNHSQLFAIKKILLPNHSHTASIKRSASIKTSASIPNHARIIQSNVQQDTVHSGVYNRLCVPIHDIPQQSIPMVHLCSRIDSHHGIFQVLPFLGVLQDHQQEKR